MSVITSQDKFNAFCTSREAFNKKEALEKLQRESRKINAVGPLKKLWHEYTAAELGLNPWEMPNYIDRSDEISLAIAYAEYIDDFAEMHKLEAVKEAIDNLKSGKKQKTHNINGKLITPKNDRERELVNIGLSSNADDKLRKFFFWTLTLCIAIGGLVIHPVAALASPIIAIFAIWIWKFAMYLVFGWTMAHVKSRTSVWGKVWGYITRLIANLIMYAIGAALAPMGVGIAVIITWIYINLKAAWDCDGKDRIIDGIAGAMVEAGFFK